MGIAWRPKTFLTLSRLESQPHKLDDLSVARLTANPKYVATASAYASAPTPPSSSRSPTGISAANASSRILPRASETSSLKVVRATSWRLVKRSENSRIPYAGGENHRGLVAISPIMPASPASTLAACMCSGVGERYNRPGFPSATIPMRCAPISPFFPDSRT